MGQDVGPSTCRRTVGAKDWRRPLDGVQGLDSRLSRARVVPGSDQRDIEDSSLKNAASPRIHPVQGLINHSPGCIQ